MNQIPTTKDPLVIRTDFSSQDAWEKLCEAVREPDNVFGFVAYVNFLDDRIYQEITKEELLARVPKNYDHSFIILVDRMTFAHLDRPLLMSLPEQLIRMVYSVGFPKTGLHPSISP